MPETNSPNIESAPDMMTILSGEKYVLLTFSPLHRQIADYHDRNRNPEAEIDYFFHLAQLLR